MKSNRIAIIEVNKKDIKGSICLYDSCSTFRPSYIARVGGYSEPLVQSLRFKSNNRFSDYRVTVMLEKETLKVISSTVGRQPQDSKVDLKIKEKITNAVRFAVAEYLGIKVNYTFIPKQEQRGGRSSYARIGHRK